MIKKIVFLCVIFIFIITANAQSEKRVFLASKVVFWHKFRKNSRVTQMIVIKDSNELKSYSYHLDSIVFLKFKLKKLKSGRTSFIKIGAFGKIYLIEIFPKIDNEQYFFIKKYCIKDSCWIVNNKLISIGKRNTGFINNFILDDFKFFRVKHTSDESKYLIYQNTNESWMIFGSGYYGDKNVLLKLNNVIKK